MGAWPELRYSQAVIIFALSNLLGKWKADCQREARAKHKARQTQLDAWRRTPRVRLRYASSRTPSTKTSGKSILSEYRSADQANFAASCLILAFWRLPAASGRDQALPRAPPGGRAPEPRAAGLGPCGSRSRGAGPRRYEKTAIHFIEQRGNPRSQRVQWAAIGRLPWREAEERGSHRGGLNR